MNELLKKSIFKVFVNIKIIRYNGKTQFICKFNGVVVFFLCKKSTSHETYSSSKPYFTTIARQCLKHDSIYTPSYHIRIT